MGERIGDLQQIGARHQLFADLLLQQDEEITHPVEVLLQVRRSAVEGTAGVHHGQGEIVPDVRVDTGQRELQRTYTGVATVLEEGTPAGGRGTARDGRVDRRQIVLREPHVQCGHGLPLRERAVRDVAGPGSP